MAEDIQVHTLQQCRWWTCVAFAHVDIDIFEEYWMQVRLRKHVHILYTHWIEVLVVVFSTYFFGNLSVCFASCWNHLSLKKNFFLKN